MSLASATRSRFLRHRLRLERLEDRTLPATVTWVGDSGDGNTPAAWSTGTLPGPADDGGRPRDTEPSLAPGTTAAETEQVLSRILSTIAREDIKYVGIIASDTLDRAFFTNLISYLAPLVVLLLAQSPATRELVVNFLEPILRVVK